MRTSPGTVSHHHGCPTHTPLTDDLTGVLERRAWENRAERIWEQARRNQRPLALALVDLDRFKRVNDTYGHPAGDEVLRATGAALRQCEEGVVGRYGRHTGDEFLVLLPDTDLAGGLSQARRLLRRIRALTVTARASRSTTVTLTGQTASIGLAACVPASGPREGLADLLLDADVALRAAKRAGRDRVRCAGGPGGEPGGVTAVDVADPAGEPPLPSPWSDPHSGEVRVPLAPYSRDPRHHSAELVMSQAAAEHLHDALTRLLGRARPAAEPLS